MRIPRALSGKWMASVKGSPRKPGKQDTIAFSKRLVGSSPPWGRSIFSARPSFYIIIRTAAAIAPGQLQPSQVSVRDTCSGSWLINPRKAVLGVAKAGAVQCIITKL